MANYHPNTTGLGNNAQLRSQTRIQGVQLAVMVAHAANMERRLRQVNDSVTELTDAVDRQTGQITEALSDTTRQITDTLTAHNDESAERSFAQWRDSTDTGHDFYYRYRPAARAEIDRIITATNWWQELLGEQMNAALDALPAAERTCILTGKFYPEPVTVNPVAPDPLPRPRPARIASSVFWIVLVGLALGLVFGAVGTFHEQGKTYTPAELEYVAPRSPLRNSDYIPAEVYGMPKGKIVSLSGTPASLHYIRVKVPGSQSSVSLPDRALNDILGAGVSYALSAGFLGMVGTWALLYVRRSRQQAAYRKARQRHDSEREQSVKDAELATQRNREQWVAANVAKQSELLDKLSDTVGYDVRSEDILEQWGQVNYLDHARIVADQLVTAYRVHPARDTWTPLVGTLRVSGRWRGTPLEPYARRLAEKIRAEFPGDAVS